MNMRDEIEDALHDAQAQVAASKKAVIKQEKMFLTDITDLGLSTDVAHAKMEEVRNATAPMMSKKQQQLFVVYKKVKDDQARVNDKQQEFLRIGGELEEHNKVVEALSEKQKHAREEAEKAAVSVETCDTRIDELNQQLRRPRKMSVKTAQRAGKARKRSLVRGPNSLLALVGEDRFAF